MTTQYEIANQQTKDARPDPEHSRTQGFLAKSTTWFVVIAFVSGVSAFAAEPFEGFLKKHCVRCHGPQKGKGDIRIDRLSRDFKAGLDAHHWAEALDKVNSGEMPPEDEPQPTQDEIAGFVTKLDSLLKEGRAAEVPLGSSGIQIRFETDLIIEGIRPGRVVGVRPGNWPQVNVPREEYLGSSTIEVRFPTPAIFPKY